MRPTTIAAAFAIACMPAAATGDPAPAIRTLTAETLRVHDAPEATQGAAVDSDYFYAVGNSVIVKYRRADGVRIGAWQGPPDRSVGHLNSCLAEGTELLCANSNFPELPMASSVEVFDAASVTHRGSHSLGLMAEGSLTWFDRVPDGWIAAFAHYDGAGMKDHRATEVVLFDPEWRRRGGWMLPDSVLERLAPASASGGQLGPDGLLYVMGHDRPEMYVLARPRMGPKLVHLATIAVEARGQAFAWDRSGAGRIVFAIDRGRGAVLEIAVPAVPVKHPNAQPFE